MFSCLKFGNKQRGEMLETALQEVTSKDLLETRSAVYTNNIFTSVRRFDIQLAAFEEKHIKKINKVLW